jgi:hypothetical protein
LWVANQEFEDYPCGESDNYVAELTAEDIFLPYFKLYRNDVVVCHAKKKRQCIK